MQKRNAWPPIRFSLCNDLRMLEGSKPLGLDNQNEKVDYEKNNRWRHGVIRWRQAGATRAFWTTWAIYFGAADVDAATQKVKSLGGSVHIEPQDIPGVGRFAFVADPQGAMFYPTRGDSDAESTAFSPMKGGHCSWNEQVTSDQHAALDFYGKLFGWKKTGAMPMGDNGDYTFIGANHVHMIGAVMNSQQAGTAPFWNIAFTVPDIDAAMAAVATGGGTITHEPIELPGVHCDWMIQANDPRGAKVMLTGRRLTGVPA